MEQSTNGNTVKFRVDMDKSEQIKEIMNEVYSALTEKGYDPMSQMVGYLLSGDPTYITSHKNARGIINRVERDEVIEEILKNYLNAIK
ncbi:MAG: IreB family regulatory phosphoprotein [Clostridia bacterium]|nr:IreB family regulatory phosphoprotein [Clostridia bacterium]